MSGAFCAEAEPQTIEVASIAAMAEPAFMHTRSLFISFPPEDCYRQRHDQVDRPPWPPWTSPPQRTNVTSKVAQHVGPREEGRAVSLRGSKSSSLRAPCPPRPALSRCLRNESIAHAVLDSLIPPLRVSPL